MNIVFLDVDGVLNSRPYFDSIKETTSLHNEIDESRLPLLKQIVEENNAKIVLSSTWRDLDTGQMEALEMYQYLENMLAKYGLQIMSKTPLINNNRPLEIKAWLDKRVDKDTISWISLDDDWTEKHYAKYGLVGHLVETKFFAKDLSEGGLQKEHVIKAKELFEKQNRYK